MKYFLIVLLLLSSINGFTQELKEIETRDEFELKLMINEESF